MRPKTNFSDDLCEPRSSTKSYAIHNLGVLEATRVLESNIEHGLSVEEVTRRRRSLGRIASSLGAARLAGGGF